jgi:hypothetical protein
MVGLSHAIAALKHTMAGLNIQWLDLSRQWLDSNIRNVPILPATLWTNCPVDVPRRSKCH